MRPAFWALVALAVFSLLQVLQWPVSPRFIDPYYHLAVMKGFLAAGGVTAHAAWEYAPVGRVHLYPPGLPLLMTPLYLAGVGLIDIARFFGAVLFPMMMAAHWFVGRRVFGERTALWAMLVYASMMPLYLSASTLPAFTLAALLGLAGFYLIQRGRGLGAGLMLGLAFYTHTGAAGTYALSFALYACFDRNRRGECVRSLVAGLLTASPWLVFQLANWSEFVGPGRLGEDRYFELDPFVLLLAGAGLSLTWTSHRAMRWPAALALAVFPLSLLYHTRALSDHLYLGLLWPAAAALSRLRGRAVLAVTAAAVLLAAPVLYRDAASARWQVSAFDRTLPKLVFPGRTGHVRGNERTIFFEASFRELADIVRDRSKPSDILWSNWNYAGGVVALLADRTTATAMLSEVRPARPFDPLASAAVFIFFKDPVEPVTERMNEAIRTYALSPVAETDLAFVLKKS